MATASGSLPTLHLPFTPPFTCAAAQLSTVQASLAPNLASHLRFIRLAGERGVHLVVFPELSLTGYELPRARELAFAPAGDARLDPLVDACKEAGVTAVVGAPVLVPSPSSAKGDAKLHIASFIFTPDGAPPALYTKQHLDNEDPPFSPGIGGPLLHFSPSPAASSTPSSSSSSPSPDPQPPRDELIALAICADTSRPAHPSLAASLNASLYCASSCISQRGYATDTGRLASYAAEHGGMAVLLANHAAPTGGLESRGGSAVWDGERRVVQGKREGREELVIVRRGGGGRWEGEVVPL
ncbi:hypothetical protein JCM6882_002274 [Rhodosporidiobolus microsporus]